jgi:hypothetical protein
MPTNRPITPPTFLIERPDLIDNFKRLMENGKRLVLIDTMAIYGSGKTTFLSQLYWWLQQQGRFEPVWLSIDLLFLPEENETARPYRLFETELFIFRDLLGSLLGAIDQKAQQEYTRSVQNKETEALLRQSLSQLGGLKVEKAESGGITVDSSASVINSKFITGDTIVKMDADYAETVFLRALDILRRHFAQEFLRCITPVLNRKKNYVLLVDNFCYIIGRQVGNWFLELLEKLENVVIVLARTVTEEDLPVNEGIVQLPMPTFNREDIYRYLVRRFGAVEGLNRLADCLMAFSRGHPGTVCLAADTIRKDEVSDIDSLIRFFEQVDREVNPADPRFTELEQRYDHMIEEVLQDIRAKDSDLEFALYAGTVLRFYDRDSLEAVLKPLYEAEEPDVQRGSSFYSSLVKRLSKYAFVEQLVGKKSDEPQYVFQNFLKGCMDLHLRNENPKLYRQIFDNARDYYQQKMASSAEKKAKKAYLKKFVLEKNQWQGDTSEWLYYLSSTEDRAATRMYFAGVYFEAFNWWNWLLPFEYCTQLRQLWQQIQKDEDDENLLRLITNLENSYPKGYNKRGQGDWPAARITLMSLKKLLGLNARLEELGDSARTVLGYLDWFIAQSYQYSAVPNYKKAEENFLAAGSIFKQSEWDEAGNAWKEDLWNLIWTESYLAEVHLDAGRPDQAIERALSSLRLATSGELESFDEQDHEVINYSYRVLGDACMQAGNLNQALFHYAQASFHACVNNVIPHDPDEYTLTLYQSVREHIAGRLVALSQTGRASTAREAAQYLVDFWSPFWELCLGSPELEVIAQQLDAADQAGLANNLFPPVGTTKKEFELLYGAGTEIASSDDSLLPPQLA